MTTAKATKPRSATPRKARAPSTASAGDESQKKRVIRSLFAIRWAERNATPARSMVVTLDDVQRAIERANKRWALSGHSGLSTRNPANFFKDIVRREQSYRSAWPLSALKRGYIGMQSKGGKTVKGTPKGNGPCFEFILATTSDPIGDLYQRVPVYRLPEATGEARIFGVQTLELPVEVRRLSREDENFLLQLIVRLRVIETHLSIVSHKRLESLVHLQMGLKLRGAEIDALFLGQMQPWQRKLPRPSPKLSDKRRVLVALEAKGKSDDILKGQIEDQAIALFRLDTFSEEIDFVVPMAAKLVGPSRIYVVEYQLIARDEIVKRRPGIAKLRLASEAFYDFSPPLRGFGD
ncbi:hypothetical protein AAKU61_002919 [Undibacterium sp. GrIS 1.2]|uniref:hypothetical protein n=1 Tax=Undibacterium sp. GrIS 1.2 TaxID=3143933 RepID=UPI003397E02D